MGVGYAVAGLGMFEDIVNCLGRLVIDVYFTGILACEVWARDVRLIYGA